MESRIGTNRGPGLMVGVAMVDNEEPAIFSRFPSYLVDSVRGLAAMLSLWFNCGMKPITNLSNEPASWGHCQYQKYIEIWAYW